MLLLSFATLWCVEILYILHMSRMALLSAIHSNAIRGVVSISSTISNTLIQELHVAEPPHPYNITRTQSHSGQLD